MTKEEKAAAYDAAIKKVKELAIDDYLDAIAVTDIFPELNESEDERIRKELISFFNERAKYTEDSTFNGLSSKDILAWLEKQAEPIEINPTEFDTRLQNLIGQFDSLPKEELLGSLGFWTNVVQNDGTYKDEKQGKQKPVDKVEPKFHKDDWIIHQGTENIYQVVAVIDNQYQLKYGDNYTIQNCADVDRCARLWDITKDTKDGDVLYLQKDGKEHIIIYKGVIKERFRTFVSAYCAYNGIVDAFCFADVSRYVDIAYRGIMPATKEQRDILFKKMKEAGYEWDSEKKELKKIEQKPAIEMKSAEESLGIDSDTYNKIVDECIYGEQKHAWSEEDDQYLLVCKNALAKYQTTDKWDASVIYRWLVNKVKSLRPQKQWKASEEQMNTLKQWLKDNQYKGDARFCYPIFESLYQDLKKLREE